MLEIWPVTPLKTQPTQKFSGLQILNVPHAGNIPLTQNKNLSIEKIEEAYSVRLYIALKLFNTTPLPSEEVEIGGLL